MYLIIAESELEPVPKEIRSDSQVLSYCRHAGKSVGKVILDSSLFHRAIKKLPQAERRGRPDLIHVALTVALDSPAARKGKLQVFVHTRNDEVIRIDSETRLPRNYNRFVGLIEQLFEKGQVPPTGKPLLALEKMTLGDLLKKLEPKEVVLFDAKGKKVGHHELKEIHHSSAVIIGGFPHGEFSQANKKLATKIVSVADTEVLAATAVAYLVTAIE